MCLCGRWAKVGPGPGQAGCVWGGGLGHGSLPPVNHRCAIQYFEMYLGLALKRCPTHRAGGHTLRTYGGCDFNFLIILMMCD